ELDAALNPARELPSSAIAGRVDVHHASERPAGEGHRSSVWLGERGLVGRRTDPDDERLGSDSATHGAVHHERQAAEHLALDNISTTREHRPNSGRSAFVVAHRVYCIFAGCRDAGGISENVASPGSSRAHEGAREAYTIIPGTKRSASSRLDARTNTVP